MKSLEKKLEKPIRYFFIGYPIFIATLILIAMFTDLSLLSGSKKFHESNSGNPWENVVISISFCIIGLIFMGIGIYLFFFKKNKHFDIWTVLSFVNCFTFVLVAFVFGLYEYV